MMSPRIFLTYFALLLASPVCAGPTVAVSIAPVHSLVSAVMEGVGVPELVIPPGQSPHTHVLTPSSAKHIYDAELIIWIGPKYELALKNAIALVGENTVVKSIETIQELESYPVREGGLWESHESLSILESSHQEHDVRADPHFWLSTANAITMVTLFRSWLSSIDSQNAETYKGNAERVISRIKNLHGALEQLLLPVKATPYIVFHDAYQYFEKEFDLRGLGSVALSPEIPPGAKRIQTLRKAIAGNAIKCLFSEPQYEPRLISTLIENTGVSAGRLDPLGADLQPGPQLWYELMSGLGESLLGCLK